MKKKENSLIVYKDKASFQNGWESSEQEEEENGKKRGKVGSRCGWKKKKQNQIKRILE